MSRLRSGWGFAGDRPRPGRSDGNYEDYEADRRRRLGAAADQPHRIKYREFDP